MCKPFAGVRGCQLVLLSPAFSHEWQHCWPAVRPRLATRCLAEYLQKQLPPGAMALCLLPFMSLPRNETCLLPRFLINSDLPTSPRASGLLLDDFSPSLYVSLLDPSLSGFCDSCIRSHSSNESLFHNTLLWLPQLNADRFSHIPNKCVLPDELWQGTVC